MTVIYLTTHYIEEAEEMADRIGVIAKGYLLRRHGKSARNGQFELRGEGRLFKPSAPAG